MSRSAHSAEILVKALYAAYENRDVEKARTLVAQNLTFTSPYDNELNLEKYFNTCWPHSGETQTFRFQHFCAEGDQVFVVYEASLGDKKFRNSEVFTVESGKIAKIEVYFGWDVPHRVPAGQHRG